MRLNKNIENTAKELYKLSINYKERKELIKTCYDCFGRIYSFPTILKEAIKEAKEQNLNGKKAYSLIEKKFQEYNNEIEKSLSNQRNTLLENNLI